MRSFVTGARGFIGRHLVARLAELGPVATLEGDLLDPRAVAPASEADVVFHLAARSAPLKGEADSAATVRTNVVGTIELATAMPAGSRIVFASTAQVYAPANSPRAEDAALAPISAYGSSKLAAEFALQGLAVNGPSAVVLRLFNTYGPGQSEDFVAGRLFAALRRGETPTLGASHPVRDFVFVDDVVEAMVLAARAPVARAEVINIGTGVGTSIGTLAKLTGREVRFAGGERAADTNHLVADASKAERLLGWRPRVTLADGVARCLR